MEMSDPEILSKEWFYGADAVYLRGTRHLKPRVGIDTMEAEWFAREVAAAALEWAAEQMIAREMWENPTVFGVKERERAEHELWIFSDEFRAKAREIRGDE